METLETCWDCWDNIPNFQWGQSIFLNNFHFPLLVSKGDPSLLDIYIYIYILIKTGAFLQMEDNYSPKRRFATDSEKPAKLCSDFKSAKSR